MCFETLLLFQWSSGCWQFDLWFLCLSKSSLNTWKFLVHILLKPCLENFEHYFASVWDECNCAVVGTFLALPFFGIRMKTDIFLWPLLSFPNLLAYWVQHIHSIIFQVLKQLHWNSITSTSFVQVMLPKAHLTSHSRMSSSRLVITPSWLSGSLSSFCIVFLCILATSS